MVKRKTEIEGEEVMIEGGEVMIEKVKRDGVMRKVNK